MTTEGESVLAGLLDALPALCAVGAPSVASQLRQVPSHWAGVYRCWGRENREAALRLVTGSIGETAQDGQRRGEVLRRQRQPLPAWSVRCWPSAWPRWTRG